MKKILGLFIFLYVLLINTALGYNLTVNGFYVGELKEGQEITVTAPKKFWYDFQNWTVHSGNLTLNNATNSSMTFTMPGNDAIIYSTYIETVINTSTYGTNLGDIDGDNKISVNDINLLSNYLKGTQSLTSAQLLKADVNSDGEVNGFDNQLLRKFLLRDVNEWPLNIKCGDVNLDGNVRTADSIQLKMFLDGKSELTAKQLLVADVNCDGVVDEFDVSLILAFCSGNFDQLPINYICGDVKSDGVILETDALWTIQYIYNERPFTAIQKLSADVNLDGNVDMFDVALLRKAITYDIQLPSKLKCGDVNLDGEIDENDISYVQEYIDGIRNLTDEQKLSADVNLDSVVNTSDKTLIQDYVINQTDYLPVNIKYGDIDGDGLISPNDALYVEEYIEGTRTFSDIQKIKADVNLDGVINVTDKSLILNCVSHQVDHLPKCGVYGDVDGGGTVTVADASMILGYAAGERELSELELLVADVNCDGKVDKFDAKLVLEIVNGMSLPSSLLCGDVDLDGYVTIADANKFMNKLSGAITFNAKQNICADVNCDNKVDKLDYMILSKYCLGEVEIPLDIASGYINDDDSITTTDSNFVQQYLNGTREFSINQKLSADVNCDGVIDKFDIRLILARSTEAISRLPKVLKCGDIDADGAVTSNDVLYIQQYIAGSRELTAEQQLVADVTCNGTVDMLDKRMIEAFVARKIDYLPSNLKYGDVDCNGSYGSNDATLINRYLEGLEPLTDKQLMLADVNLDGTVDKFDYMIFTKSLTSQFELPLAVICGDVDNDGNISATDSAWVKQYIKGTKNFTDTQELAADVNCDGRIDDFDADIILKYCVADTGTMELPLVVICGDVNGDGEVTMDDTSYIYPYIYDEEELTSIQFITADVNLDKEVDQTDITLIQKAVADEVQLPYTDTFKVILEVYTNNQNRVDGGICTGDGTYGGYSTVTLEAKPNPGYVFDHWQVLQGSPAISNQATTSFDIRDEVRIRAHFVLAPEIGSYVNCGNVNGYSGNWVVLRNTTNAIEIISKESVHNLSLDGDYGYGYVVEMLNNICSSYINEYGVSVRSVGATNSSINAINPSQLTYSQAIYQVNSEPYTDYNYQSDADIISSNKNFNSSSPVWLASREARSAGNYIEFCVRYLVVSGTYTIADRMELLRTDNNNNQNYYSSNRGVRPVMKLGLDVQITSGYGTEEEPYILGIAHETIPTGSYVNYNAGDYTGKWVVLRDTAEGIEIISKESVGNLTLSGADGYANAVKILNDKAKEYVNPAYAVSARSVGATNSSIEQINTTDNPLTYAAARTQELPYHDTYYTTDQSIISGNANLKHSSGYVWLASRTVNAENSTSYFRVRGLGANGRADISTLFSANSSGSTSARSTGSFGVRPVITLKRVHVIGGSGTEGSPYTIGL